MLRVTQIFRNLFIRFEGFFSIVFKSISNPVKNFFGFLGKLFGFTKSDYFLEPGQAQSTNLVKDKQPIEVKQNTTTQIAPATIRRRPNAKLDDYFLNMARDVKKN
jgi:hypothetical protein